VSPTNRLHACFGQAEVFDLTFLDELFDGAGDIFNGHIRIDAVLIEQIDHAGLQPLERRVGNSPDALRPAVQALMRVSVLEAELACDHDLFPECQCRLKNPQFAPIENSPVAPVENSPGAERL
jgi:hypothetical protein